MEVQNSNKIIRRCLDSAMSQKIRILPQNGQFNRTIKINKRKLEKEGRKSFNFSQGLNLPQINLLPSKNHNKQLNDQEQNKQSGQIHPQKELSSHQMNRRKSKFNMHKTIFSYLQNPLIEPKVTKRTNKNSSKNSQSSKSKQRKSSSFNKLNLNKNDPESSNREIKTKYKVKNQKDFCENQKKNLSQKVFNAQDLIKKQLQNQLSAKEIILNSPIKTNENFKNSKIPTSQNKLQQIQRGNPQSPEKNLSRVESGLQMIRQNKLKSANQLIINGETQKATEILNFLLKVDENDLEVMYILAKISQQQKKQELSKKYLRLIILNQANSFKLDQQILKVKALQKLGKYDEAIQKIQFIEKQASVNFLDEQKVQLLKIKGQIFYKNQLLEYALQSFQDALEIVQIQGLQKLKGFLYQKIGQIYFHYKMYKKAQKYLQLCIKQCQKQNSQVDEKILHKITICNANKNKKFSSKKIQFKICQNLPLQKDMNDQQKVKNQEKNQNNTKEQAYKISITNHKGDCQVLNMKDSKTVSKDFSVQSKQKFPAVQQQLDISQSMKKSSLLFEIQESARLNYKMGNFEKVYQDFEKYINLSTYLKESNVNLKINSKSIKASKNQQRYEQISQGLNYYLLKIKQLQMNEMIEENLSEITKRRNYNITQAIKLFDSYSLQASLQQSSKLRALSVIGQESTTSVIKNSQLFGESNQKLNDIFCLKQFRQVFKAWNDDQFSLDSLDKIAAITYDLVKNDKTDFSIMPFHIIAYSMKMLKQKHSFGDINKKVQQKLIDLCKKYPPSQKSITQSELKKFQINFSDKQKVDLFQGQQEPQNFKTIYKHVQELARQAQLQKKLMDQICKEICLENEGFSYKSNLKLPLNNDRQKSDKNERVYCRIIEKILSKELKNKKDNFFQSIQFKQEMKVKDLFVQLSQRWEQTIDEILKQKIVKKEKTHCYVYDLMRAKAMFSSIKDIDTATEVFIKGDNKGQYKIIEIDNRLNNKTKDVVLKIQFNKIVGELQLALQFQSQKNEFNHSLYELSRSPFGSFFASFMWLTGFATSNESSKLVFNEKMKWKMRRIEHLKKFIYEEKLIIELENQQVNQIIKKQFNCDHLYLEDFVVKMNSIEGYMKTSKGEYVDINLNNQNLNQSRILVKSIIDSKISINDEQNTETLKLCLNESKPLQKFRFFFTNQRQSFASHQKFNLMTINLNGTNYFLNISMKDNIEMNLVMNNQLNSQNNNQNYEQGSSILNQESKKVFRINFIGQKYKDTLIDKSSLTQNDKQYQEQIEQIIGIQKSLNQIVRKNFTF